MAQAEGNVSWSNLVIPIEGIGLIVPDRPAVYSIVQEKYLCSVLHQAEPFKRPITFDLW